MLDITMCTGEECPLKENCYRYTAKPSDYQSYFVESPIENEECKYFWRDEVRSKTDKSDQKVNQ